MSHVYLAPAGPSSDEVNAPRHIRLADGRRLAWAEYGEPAGPPLFFFHGLPSSRFAGEMLHAAAAKHGVRLIAPERPGFGLSDPLPTRRILDWPRDVAAVAAALDLPRFSVLGISSGLPYAAACGVVLPQQVEQVALFSGLGRLDVVGVLAGMPRETRTMYGLALKSPRVASLWMRAYGPAVRRAPEQVLAQQLRLMPAVDREILTRPQNAAIRINDLREAFRQGGAAAGLEARLHFEDWGFGLEELEVPVYLWQGMLDRSHPLPMGRHHAATLASCRAVFAAGAGALGFLDRMDTIFPDLFPPPDRKCRDAEKAPRAP